MALPGTIEYEPRPLYHIFARLVKLLANWSTPTPPTRGDAECDGARDSKTWRALLKTTTKRFSSNVVMVPRATADEGLSACRSGLAGGRQD